MSVLVAGATSIGIGTASYADLSFNDFSLPVNSSPHGIAAGDCNDDGIPDLIIADQGSDDATILRNVGGGVFAFLASVPVADAPRAAVCADVDKDGRIDIAVVSRSQATLTVYRRKDQGGYERLVTVGVGNQPNAVVAVDLNEDGNVDFVVANQKSNTLTVLFGNGAGAFPLVTTIGLPLGVTAPVGLATADFNLDGHADLAVAARSKGSHLGNGAPIVLMYAGDGHGTFTLRPPTTVPAPPDPVAIAAADLDNDGIPDLGVLSTDSTITLYLATLGGAFQTLPPINVGANARGLAFGDFDADGLVDLAITFADSNSAQVVFATGRAQFPPPNAAGSRVIVNPFGDAALRSIEVDPDVTSTDLVFANAAGHSLDVVAMADFGTVSATPLLLLPGTPLKVLVADMTSDGIPDAVVAASGKHGLELSILPGGAAGGYEARPSDPARCGDGVAQGAELCDDGNELNGDGCSKWCTPELGRRLSSLAAADMNGDGKQDLVAVNARGDLLVLIGDGAGRFSAVRKLARVRAKTTAVVADIDGDGIVDIAAVPRSRLAKGIATFLNDGTGQFASGVIPMSARAGASMLAADLDRNGFTDLAVATADKPTGIAVLLNDGAGGMVDAGIVPVPRRLARIAAADFDEDGWLDLLATFGSTRQPPLIFRSLKEGAFADGEPALAEGGATNATVVDINNDSHQDLVVCRDGFATACDANYGDGMGRFAKTPPPSARVNYIGRQLRAVAVADLDGDTIPDFVGVSRRDAVAVVLFRDATGAITQRVTLPTGVHPRAVAIGDLNGDQRPDLAVVNEGSNTLSLFINQGNRAFQTLMPRPLKADGNTPSDLAIGDLDGDGKLDIVVSFQYSSTVALFY